MGKNNTCVVEDGSSSQVKSRIPHILYADQEEDITKYHVDVSVLVPSHENSIMQYRNSASTLRRRHTHRKR